MIGLMKGELVKEANDKLALIDFEVTFNKYQQAAKEKIEKTLAKMAIHQSRRKNCLI